MELSDLIVRYIGHGEYPVPRRAWDGIEVTDDQGAQVVQIVGDVVSFDLDWANKSLGEGADEAVRAVSEKRPYLSEPALSALRWLFAHEWK